MSSTAHPPSQRFPNEVLSLIFEDVSSTETLWALCRTSRTLFVIAQPMLYRCVRLDGRRMSTVRNWSRTVSKYEYLAKCVQSLSLTLPELALLDPRDVPKIFTTLRKCVNLEEFEITSSSTTPCLLPDVPFPRLTKLRTPHFRLDNDLHQFLRSHPTIRMLELLKRTLDPVPDDWLTFFNSSPTELLPELTAFSGSRLTLPLNHGLQRIAVDPVLDDVGFLHGYAATLTTLNLVVPRLDASQASSLAYSAFHSLPALIHFAIVETKARLLTEELAVDLPPSSFIGAFTSLETFTLMSRTIDFLLPGRRERYACDTEEGMHDLALGTLNVSATLNRVVIGYQVSLNKERTCTATRGAASTRLEKGMDFEAVSMFWV
ncbi:hypothetical protein MKEN_00742200 [Mycena kentingensis (nom. inval.)]|nr:hypothetical protein MKEN_00742200 [Mycena kentingensis (nom. inval.)]